MHRRHPQAVACSSSPAFRRRHGGFAMEESPMSEQIPAAPPPAVISTDRGSFGDGTSIVPPFRVNLEMGATAAWRDRDGTERRLVTGPEAIIRVGLIEDRLELRALWSGHVDSVERSSGSRSGADGWSDVALGIKLKLLEQEGLIPRSVLIAQTFVGAGSAEVTGDVDPTVKGAFSWDLGGGVGLLANAGASWPSDGDGHWTQGLGSALVSWSVLEETTVFAEYYALFPAGRGDDAAHAVDFGVWQRIGPAVQLDVRVGFGLNEAADDLLVGAGIAFLF
jgi:hypothetical protein